MRPMVRFAHLLALVALAILAVALSGCSSGSAGGPVSASSGSASGQAAAAVFVQQWSQTLWGLVTSQTGTQTPSFGDPVFNPDGSVTQSFTGADGTTVVLTTFPDGSARLDITWPDGTTQTVQQSVPQFDGVSRTTTDWQLTSGDGLSVSYTSVVDDQGTIFDISDDTTELQGTSVLPGNLTQEFHVLTASGQTAVQATQSDGSAFTLTVPLSAPDFTFPDFSQASTGVYGGPGFTITFTLASTADAPSRWAKLMSDLGGGVTGEFSLNPDFSGSGQLIEAGQLTALLSWTQTGETEVSFLTAERSATSPAGAALDFLLHRWQTLTALLAPAPGASSLQDPSRLSIYSPRASGSQR
ncbi:MAG: hypothetical protein JSV65_07610 [Armatimonadota bacterium]|nr:MAG: hypothetical protein JSV65_07610 [Armatimonadota bacterium]